MYINNGFSRKKMLMNLKDHHEHIFTYFLKESKNGELSAQVRELPGIFAQGKSKEEIEIVLPKMTKQYLKSFGGIHTLINNNTTAKTLMQPGYGKLLAVNSFICKC
jgi:predicted RNase H-like HicB family nuclease